MASHSSGTPPVPPGEVSSQRRNDEELQPAYPLFVEFTNEATERGQPPTYEEAMNPSALPPPSYDSLFGRIREAHKESSGTIDFISNVIILLVGTVGFTAAIGFTTVIPIAMIVIGSTYMFDCPLNYQIPLYLFVGGSLGIMKQLVHLFNGFKKGNRGNEEDVERRSIFHNGLSCLMTGWFILGSFWVYKEYKPNYDPNIIPYCDRTVYLFAFWQITSVYIVLGIMSLCLCSVSLAVVAFSNKQSMSSPS